MFDSYIFLNSDEGWRSKGDVFYPLWNLLLPTFIQYVTEQLLENQISPHAHKSLTVFCIKYEELVNREQAIWYFTFSPLVHPSKVLKMSDVWTDLFFFLKPSEKVTFVENLKGTGYYMKMNNNIFMSFLKIYLHLQTKTAAQNKKSWPGFLVTTPEIQIKLPPQAKCSVPFCRSTTQHFSPSCLNCRGHCVSANEWGVV